MGEQAAKRRTGEISLRRSNHPLICSSFRKPTRVWWEDERSCSSCASADEQLFLRSSSGASGCWVWSTWWWRTQTGTSPPTLSCTPGHHLLPTQGREVQMKHPFVPFKLYRRTFCKNSGFKQIIVYETYIELLLQTSQGLRYLV